MFSVIIPLYNKEKYIAKAIQSVLAQTFQEYELIIIDDGSTDNSYRVAQEILSSQQVAERSRSTTQPNSGVSTTRNRGVELAKYNYIAFLDADDWWAPTYLEEMKMLIEEFPDAALYTSSYYSVKNNKNRPAKIGVPDDFKKGYFDYFKAYANSNWMPVCTGATILRKDKYLEMNGFKPHLKLGEDFDLWVRIALKYKVALLNKPLAYYNQDVEQIARAIGKLHSPSTHMLWNLEYLGAEEKKNLDLKQMLDNLRTYGLFPYYLNKETRELAKQ
ncbi:MAG: glycosyltransferase family A protein, partial [Arcobacteraceae bacterium]|nr:glycosyltransferase family A protein [Arcobacteraceae bacterium]